MNGPLLAVFKVYDSDVFVGFELRIGQDWMFWEQANPDAGIRCGHYPNKINQQTGKIEQLRRDLIFASC